MTESLSLEEIEALFTGDNNTFHFARWNRPIVPIVFGVDDETLTHLKSSIVTTVGITGNKIEDFGVGFYTKYGDGGVDISPIGDCLKTAVWDMGREFGLPQEIIDAPPTDGLWADDRNDEDQLGMTYPELEKAMDQDTYSQLRDYATAPEKRLLKRYREIRAKNLHKMDPIPVCKIPH